MVQDLLETAHIPFFLDRAFFAPQLKYRIYILFYQCSVCYKIKNRSYNQENEVLSMNKNKSGAIAIEYILAFVVSMLVITYLTLKWYPSEVQNAMTPMMTQLGHQSYEALTDHDQMRN